MKFFKKSVAIAAAITTLGFSAASSAAEFTGPRSVVSIQTNNAGSLFVVLDVVDANPSNCSSSSAYFLNANGASGARGMYAMLLTAQASGQRVSLGIDGCSGGGTAGFPLIISSRIAE